MENIIEYVHEKWNKLTSFSKKEELKSQMWDEVLYRYSAHHRHYHNLNHIAHLFFWCDKFIGKITNPAVVGFAILYHDVVYDTFSANNVELSAEFAESHLKQLNVNAGVINNVKTFIKATKDHTAPEGFSLKDDLVLFLDFDMAILGVDEDTYNLYSKKIRQEYLKYPDEVYNEGRKLALQKVLLSEKIFYTDEFIQEMQQRALENINREVSLL